MAAGLAAQRFGPKLENEQEILVNIADIVANIYAMESAVLRTEKAINRSGVEKTNKNFFIRKFSAKKRSTKSKHMQKRRLWRLSRATHCA